MSITESNLSLSISRSFSGTRDKRSVSRKVLGENQTPSLYDKGEGHDCSLVDPESTAVKVEMRFAGSMLRFSLASGWGCKTKRGPTLYNGSICKCGKCQAAHATLSPNLEDDQLQIITKDLKILRFQELPEHHQTYLIKRFRLSNDDKENLSHETANARIERMEEILSRLQENERKGTFAGTDLEKIRNATFANPTASNRIDCFLENSLRPLEEQLSEQCSLSEITPKEALQKLHEKYLELLVTVKTRLEKDLEYLEVLEISYTQLILSKEALTQGSPEEEQKAKKIYLEHAHAYQNAYRTRFTNAGKGVPLFFGLRKALKPSASLENLEHPEENFKKAKGEVQKRLDEVKAQLQVVSLPFQTIHTQMKHSLGAKTSSSVLETPTKNELRELFYSRMKQVTPSRSDLSRKTGLPYKKPRFDLALN